MPLGEFTWRSQQHGARRAADAVDQHADAWCGCCYLVAALTSVSDRVSIARNERVRLCLQSAADAYQEWGRDGAWNVCLGGSVADVVECMTRGACGLVRVDERTWMAHALQRDACARSEVVVLGWRAVRECDVRAEIRTRGPVVLQTTAKGALDADARGVAQRADAGTKGAATTPPDHSVVVVGWKRVRGVGTCWIARNSWGTATAPRALPADVQQCVSVGRNACAVQTRPWKGMPSDPGFYLLPCADRALHASESPWMAIDVAL